MEKIYEGENNNNKQKKSVINLSVILSFTVAVVAMFSLMIFGFNKVSYAVPDTAPETMTVYRGLDSTTESMYPMITSYISDKHSDDSVFKVPLYFSDTGLNIKEILFCIEHNKNVVHKDLYGDKVEITDAGLLYLLSNSFVNGVYHTDASETNRDYLEAYITQVAIWMYLYEKDPTNPANDLSIGALVGGKNETLDSNKVKENIMNATVLQVTGDGLNGVTSGYIPYKNIYTTYISPLVAAAKSASELNKVEVKLDSKDLVKSEDGNYYQTSIVSVIATGDMTGYDLKIDGIDGAFAVDENGQELNTTNVAPGTKFYVRIPANKITEEVQNLNISATGHFKTVTGYAYASTSNSSGLQKLVKVVGKNVDVPHGITLEVIGAPDTGMNVAQTIYFIGLVVLLCGIGIVYANAKPVQIKE